MHSWRTLSRGAEKPQESTHRDNNSLGTPEPMTARTLQRKAAQNLCRVAVWVAAVGGKKLDDDCLINVQARLGQSAMLVHP